ncbi:MAG TPA: hypothetical protein VEX88_01270 [Glaciibacter sp.]|nr:hypothetical protein [Glaciibacter sp.]
MLERPIPWFRSGQSQLWACAALVGVGVLLVGCDANPAARPSTAAPSSTTEPSAPAATPQPAPTFKADLAASENQDYFDWVAVGVLATDRNAGGRAFIDALTAGGFDRSQMELTFDRTAVDLEADSIQFSVRVHGECVIGQAGPGDSFSSIITAPLGTGTCLVGSTRQIDW